LVEFLPEIRSLKIARKMNRIIKGIDKTSIIGVNNKKIVQDSFRVKDSMFFFNIIMSLFSYKLNN
jgi:hypothetical protein